MADLADSADWTDWADLSDSTDSADLADSTEPLKGFSVSFTLLLKVLHLLVSYPLSYTWLKGEQQISRKEKIFPGTYSKEYLVIVYFSF